jgi:hypothetical protein
MVTIVKHIDTGKKYVFIGTGYGTYRYTRASIWGGNISPNMESGEKPVVAVADRKGTIKWIETECLQVLEIDGRKLKDIYSEIPHDDC